jgi:uncharacterized protein YkwD
VCSVVLAASAAAAVLQVSPTEAAASTCGSVETSAESRFVSKLNSLRQSRGLPTLAVNPEIAAQADGWSAHMSSVDRLYHARESYGVSPSHDYVNLIASVVPDWTRAGENVGVSGLSSCSSTDRVVDALHSAFVGSSGHFRNMIGDFNQVGVGVHTDPDQLWVTVRFAKGSVPKPPPTYSQNELAAASRYIHATYGLFLGRAPTSAAVTHWSPTVASGDRASLTRALATSDEWAGTRVSQLYLTILDRDAEPTGRAGWVEAIRRGTTLEYVAAGIYGSKERFALSGGTNEGYVEDLYHDLLGRPADEAGFEYWVGALDRGTRTRTQVASGFYGSIESRTDRVTALYEEILGRAPDAIGLDHWTSRLLRMGDIVLASTLATSTEYWNRATA